MNEPHFGRPQVLVALAIALLLALVSWQVIVVLDQQRKDSKRAEAVSVSTAQVRDLVSLNSENVNDKLKALDARTTGTFRRQLAGLTEVFVSTVHSQKITARGRVAAVGIESISGNRAKVLVAAVAKVSNAKQKQPTTRGYRMRISLRWINSRWLVSNMEYVQ